MRMVFPDLGGLEVRGTQQGAIRIQFEESPTSFTAWVDALSIFAAGLYDRYLRYASALDLSTGTSKEYTFLLVLDEPTAALHPQLFPSFVRALNSLNVQTVLATHSVDFFLQKHWSSQ